MLPHSPNQLNWIGACFKCKINKNGSIQTVWCNPSLRKPWDLDLKMGVNVFSSQNLHCGSVGKCSYRRMPFLWSSRNFGVNCSFKNELITSSFLFSSDHTKRQKKKNPLSTWFIYTSLKFSTGIKTWVNEYRQWEQCGNTCTHFIWDTVSGLSSDRLQRLKHEDHTLSHTDYSHLQEH